MTAEEDVNHVNSVALILAAGSSSRMGQSKQLLKVGDESLLRKTILTVAQSEIKKIAVVLGARAKEHRQEISDLAVDIIFNSDWEKGMGSSLKYGVQSILENFPNCQVIVVTVCDQPLLTSRHLNNLMNTYLENKSPIVSSYYADSPGTPVLFNRSMSTKLLAINDNHGAKKVVLNHLPATTFIEFPEGAIDLDTPQDWQQFNSR